MICDYNSMILCEILTSFIVVIHKMRNMSFRVGPRFSMFYWYDSSGIFIVHLHKIMIYSYNVICRKGTRFSLFSAECRFELKL